MESVDIVPPLTSCTLDGGNIPGVIVAVEITRDVYVGPLMVRYEVMWWDGGEVRSAWFPPALIGLS